MGTIYVLELEPGQYWGTGDFGQGVPQGPTDNPHLAAAFGTTDEAREHLRSLRRHLGHHALIMDAAIVPHAEAAAAWKARRDADRVPFVEVDQEWMPGDVVPYRMSRSVRVF